VTALRRTGYLVGLPLLLVLVWWITTRGDTNFFVPTPEVLLDRFVSVWFGERFFADILPSLGRLVVGLVTAIVLGVGAGVLIGSFRTLRSLTEPVLEFFRAIPPPVLIPVLMLVIGINDGMRVAVIVAGCVWPILLNTIEGVRAVDPVLRESARVYGVRGWRHLVYLVLPGASPPIAAGIRQALSIGLILMVISEMFYASNGLGYSIVQFQRSFAVPEMWSGILVLGLVGLGLSALFRAIERRVLRWYHGVKQVEHAR
jgi:ABC-type nitrate/sulfonate/bicarbonate transport system permease component